MRLVKGTDACHGRVEVLHDGKWGTVCYDDWDALDGAVVCKEIGCGNIEAYGAYFGATSGQIWMDNVNCTGEEAALSTCAFQGWGTHNGLFTKHAGVKCGCELQIVNLLKLHQNCHYLLIHLKRFFTMFSEGVIHMRD